MSKYCAVTLKMLALQLILLLIFKQLNYNKWPSSLISQISRISFITDMLDNLWN